MVLHNFKIPTVPFKFPFQHVPNRLDSTHFFLLDTGHVLSLDMYFCPPRTWVPCPRRVNSSCGKAEFEPGVFFVCFASQFTRDVVYQTTSNNLVLVSPPDRLAWTFAKPRTLWRGVGLLRPRNGLGIGWIEIFSMTQTWSSWQAQDVGRWNLTSFSVSNDTSMVFATWWHPAKNVCFKILTAEQLFPKFWNPIHLMDTPRVNLCQAAPLSEHIELFGKPMGQRRRFPFKRGCWGNDFLPFYNSCSISLKQTTQLLCMCIGDYL